MRTLLLALVAIALAGCAEPAPAPAAPATSATPPVEDEACPAAPGGPGEGAPVEVQVANNMAEAACVRVYFDGTLVAAGQLEGERPALHNNPRTLSRTAWPASEVTVRVDDGRAAGAHEERVRVVAGRTTYVVAWVDESGITVRTYDQAPRWS